MRIKAATLKFVALLLVGVSHVTQAATPALTYLKEQGIHIDMVTADHRGPIPLEAAGNEITILSTDGSKTKFFSYDLPVLEVLKRIQKAEGEVVMECGLFVQIAGILNSPSPNKCFVIFSHENVDLIEGSILFQAQLGYVHPVLEESFDTLQSSTLLNKGQWVIRTGPDDFMGLVRGGPITASRDEWVSNTKADLFKELDGRLQNLSQAFCISETRLEKKGSALEQQDALERMESGQMKYINLLRKMGFLDDWQLTLSNIM